MIFERSAVFMVAGAVVMVEEGEVCHGMEDMVKTKEV